MISLSPKRLSLRAALQQSISTFPKGLDSRVCPGARLSFPLDMRYRAGVRSRSVDSQDLPTCSSYGAALRQSISTFPEGLDSVESSKLTCESQAVHNFT
ncbi:hypothetical protein EBU02_12625 [bacterium]|nr:hypothetical protein [bacterium]NBS53894.1 hypothetical protein [Spartobacteria bacterium]